MKTPRKRPARKADPSSGKSGPSKHQNRTAQQGASRSGEGKSDFHRSRPKPPRNNKSAKNSANQGQASGRGRGQNKSSGEDRLFLYGVHTVKSALANPKRKKLRLFATTSGLDRIADALPNGIGGTDRTGELEIREAQSSDLQNLVGTESVHQGVVLECAPLDPLDASELFPLAQHDLLLVLDQVTDPHNVGAILRSAVALQAGAIITTARHAASETAVLAKSASGAVDLIDQMPVRNLSKTLLDLADLGFAVVGLDSEGPTDLAQTLTAPLWQQDRRFKDKPRKLAIVLGAEGKGLRQQTREACTTLARLDMPGPIRSLNVSNAAVLALYLARAALTDAR